MRSSAHWRRESFTFEEGDTSMIAINHPLASRAIKAAVTVKRLLQRFANAVIAARMRRVRQEIELHRSFGA
jgi:hypothetical protein